MAKKDAGKGKVPLRREQKRLLLVACAFMAYIVAFNYVPIPV